MQKCRPGYFMAVIVRLLFVYLVYIQDSYSQNAVPPDEVHTKRILVLGDSLSAAYQMPVEAGWVSLLQEKLRVTHTEYELINASVSGATTAAGISILEGMLSSAKPSIVILALGANDGLQGKAVPYISKNLEYLVRLSQEAGSKVVLLGIRLPPNFGTRYSDPFFSQYGKLAEEYNLPVFPFLLKGVAGNPDLIMSDGLHPNEKAQPILLDNVWSVLSPVL